MGWLVLTFQEGESAVLTADSGRIEVKVAAVERGRVRLAIVAPAEWRVTRSKIGAAGEPPQDADSLLR